MSASSNPGQFAQNIKIRFRSYNSNLLDKAVGDVMAMARKVGISIVGPVCIPSRTTRFAVNKSPHVDARSKDIFAISRHCRMIIILDATHAAIESISSIDLSSGVGIEIEVTGSKN